MPINVNSELADFIAAWVTDAAKKFLTEAVVDPTHLTQDGDWIHVPVTIADDIDAYESAKLLTNIEYAWNDDPPKPGIMLLLLPAKSGARAEKSKEVDFLLERQRHLLDEIGDAEADQSSADRYFRIREEWENTVDERRTW